jgi:hypothetical protein
MASVAQTPQEFVSADTTTGSELTRPAVSQNGGIRPAKIPPLASEGHRRVKAIAGLGVVAEGAEEATGEALHARIRLRYPNTMPLPHLRSWLTHPPPQIPQKNLPRLPSPTPGRCQRKKIPRVHRRIQIPFHLRQAPALQTDKGDLNMEDDHQTHRTLKANTLTFKH